jgi:hypothetical protein
MTRYELDIPEGTIALAIKHGFDPSAPISPSAAGMPVSTGLTQEAYERAVDTMLSASRLSLLARRQQAHDEA